MTSPFIEIQQLLSNVQSSNISVINAASLINQYTEAVKLNQISKEEYAELVIDVQRSINIQAQMIELAVLEEINTAINSLLTIAGNIPT